MPKDGCILLSILPKNPFLSIFAFNLLTHDKSGLLVKVTQIYIFYREPKPLPRILGEEEAKPFLAQSLPTIGFTNPDEANVPVTCVQLRLGKVFIALGIWRDASKNDATTQGWAGLFLPIAGITVPEPGYKFTQGLIAAIAAAVALGLLFFKPKFAAIPALIVVGAALALKFMPPVIEGETYEPQKAIYFAIGGGVLLAIAALIAPKKA